MPSRVLERYFAQEYLTPGVRKTEDLVRKHVAPTADTRILEIASGKGTTAIRFAARYGCTVVGVDPYLPFLREASKKARTVRGAAFVFGDGGRAPVRDSAFDSAICIGAPSIVGTARCFRAMFRALRPGGIAVASDWTWTTDSPPPAAVPAGVAAPFLTLDTYASIVRAAGFDIVVAEPLPHGVWDDYYHPLRVICAEERALNPEMPEDSIEAEIKAYDAGGDLWHYSAFVARKP
jgi:ubiquinone/menaquinone biosynthesis C-methylase UbiE